MTQHYADFDVQLDAVLGPDQAARFRDAERFLTGLYARGLAPRRRSPGLTLPRIHRPVPRTFAVYSQKFGGFAGNAGDDRQRRDRAPSAPGRGRLPTPASAAGRAAAARPGTAPPRRRRTAASDRERTAAPARPPDRAARHQAVPGDAIALASPARAAAAARAFAAGNGYLSGLIVDRLA